MNNWKTERQTQMLFSACKELKFCSHIYVLRILNFSEFPAYYAISNVMLNYPHSTYVTAWRFERCLSKEALRISLAYWERIFPHSPKFMNECGHWNGLIETYFRNLFIFYYNLKTVIEFSVFLRTAACSDVDIKLNIFLISAINGRSALAGKSPGTYLRRNWKIVTIRCRRENSYPYREMKLGNPSHK